MSTKPPPRSCDTFVALPPATANTTIIFAKNSDRPDDEVQEVVALPATSHPPNSTVQCTYITIPQVNYTHAVVLSKPVWMWGAEMAANDQGLTIGNEAVWTTEPDDGPPALLGMDLLRLAAERCSTAESAVDTIAQLLDTYGQGGGCAEGDDSFSYHNSFLIADRKEAWVMETAGKWWVAERITEGYRNISNCLSIRNTFDKYHPQLFEYCGVEMKNSAGSIENEHPLDWAASFSSGGAPPRGKKSSGRESSGYALLQKAAATPQKITVESMMDILRDTASGICMCGGGFTSTGSQVSIIHPLDAVVDDNNQQKSDDIHWFTGTPDPSKSVFKPFIFPGDAGNSKVGCPELMEARLNNDSVPKQRVHKLWQTATIARRKNNSTAKDRKAFKEELQGIENKYLEMVESGRITKGNDGTLFAQACREEMDFYNITCL